MSARQIKIIEFISSHWPSFFNLAGAIPFYGILVEETVIGSSKANRIRKQCEEVINAGKCLPIAAAHIQSEFSVWIYNLPEPVKKGVYRRFGKDMIENIMDTLNRRADG